MKLVVVIPCFNEEKTIGKVIEKIPTNIKGIDEIEIIVVDDGSSDQSAHIAKQSGASVISATCNRGVGSAFILGVETALSKGVDIMVNIDADNQFNPKQIPTLIKPIMNGEADFTTCSRFKDRTLIPAMPAIKIWGNRQMAKLVSILTGQKFYDVSCGFRAYSKESLLHLNLFGKFTYTQESLLDLAYKGIRVVEVPLKVRGEREFGESRVAKHVVSYGYKSFKIILRTIRDYKPLRFFGYMGIILFSIGIIIGFFFLAYWLRTGATSPYKSLAFISAFLIALGFVIFLLALVADMLDRLRMNQEKLLYYEKKREHDQRK